ncbi:hypothetical protein L7F22_000682 [Adiantum nelumboides]|nr:hypothetical protein [Adiantum nelumboides]
MSCHQNSVLGLLQSKLRFGRYSHFKLFVGYTQLSKTHVGKTQKQQALPYQYSSVPFPSNAQHPSTSSSVHEEAENMGACLSHSFAHFDKINPRSSCRGSSRVHFTEELEGGATAPSSFPLMCPPAALAVRQTTAHFGYRRGFKSTYKLERQVGQGSFGRTFIATHLRSGAQAAVKAIQKSKLSVSISVADVKREVKIMQVLSGHENVVKFYDAFEDKDFVYIVMELCRGGELLSQIVSMKGSQDTERDAARIVRQMLTVVARCHLCGIVHRDLKPENFLFKSNDDSSELKAIDFGLSDFIRPGRAFKDVVGSACYLAPEVLKRRSGAESDVWSVGVITYLLLCGRRPFLERTEGRVFKKILEEEPDYNEKPWTTISSSAKDFVRKLLVKDPRARLTAAQALSHPWLREEEASDVPLDISVLSNIREFVRCSHLRKIALRAVTSILSDAEIANLEDQFNAMDTDKDGTLSHAEIHEALAKDKTWHLQEAKVMEVLRAMDTNKDGRIDFEEFAVAAVQVRQMEGHGSVRWHKQCAAAFDKLDVDNNGYIIPDELKLVSSANTSFVSLIDEADMDKDGRLNLQEFEMILR